MTDYLTAGAARAALGISQRQLEHFLGNRPHLEPARIGGRRVWTSEEMDALRVAWEAAVAERDNRAAERARGAQA